VAARKIFVCLCLTSILISGCAANHVGQEEHATPGTRDIVVRAIGYDDKGLPLPGAPLAERPFRPGDHFTVVRLLRDRPVISYDVVVVRRKPDFARPLQVVYEWTGKGFTLGANVTQALLNSAGSVQIHGNDGAALVVLAILVTPAAAGTVGGFIVGIADGARQTALELSKVIVPGEQLVTCTTFEYDGLNRLVVMRMFSPDRMQELVRTRFAYEGAETVPSRTTVRTLAEGKERDIN
jgi:hypothetical protein